jgi:nicotinamidase-related amidase
MDALILIDLQVGLCKPEGVAGAVLAPVVAETGTLEKAAACLDVARTAGTEVVHVRLAFDPAYARRTNRTARFDDHEGSGRFQEDSVDSAFCPEVAPRPGELVVSKGSVSPFASTALATWLHAREIRRFAVCGVATHLAVESAAREGADRGFRPTVISDACAAPDDMHRHAIDKTIPAFADVVTAAEFEMLAGQSARR